MCQDLRQVVSVEDQSKNGVRVIVTRFHDGTVVDASCSCFGSEHRVHSTSSCPVYKSRLTDEK